LKKWREDIDQAVSEGNEYEQYANIYLPKAKTDAENIALTLVHFKRVKYDDLPKNDAALLSKEKKGEEITRRIVTTMQQAQAIEIVAYLKQF